MVLDIRWRNATYAPLGLHGGQNVWRTQFDAARVAAIAVPWLPLIPHEVNDVELLWELIWNGILHLTDTCAPATRSRPRTLEPPWFDPEVRRLLRRRNRAWRGFGPPV
ncbi:unnamed protein product [Echinostoma caproni]|uniref:DDE_3 domain-containing protein n=1 Tax=Echinostoma caproni TaxID=27848 RepID=A0A183A849_9TREM|nr:unnamed protein product [Echinostoma caproni]